MKMKTRTAKNEEFCRSFVRASCWSLDQSIDNVPRALFSQALSELKYMGMIKNSRKKADHLVKLSWKGL